MSDENKITTNVEMELGNWGVDETITGDCITMEELNQMRNKALSKPEQQDGLGGGKKQLKGKEYVYPVQALDILGKVSQVGLDKGYKKDSWWINNDIKRSVWIDAALRHLVKYQNGTPGDEGWYTEYKEDGTPCSTQSNHIYAACWNLMRVAFSIYFGRKSEDDRWKNDNS